MASDPSGLPPGKRLLWSLEGPLRSAISVLAEDLNPDGPREPYITIRRGQASEEDRHPISNEPITAQPVASLTVTEEYLSHWLDKWWTINQEGFDKDVQPAQGDEPPTFEPLVVTASNGEFVTIHDYVSAILRASHAGEDDYTPGAAADDERLLICAQNTEMVSAQDEREWLETLRWIFEENERRREQQGKASWQNPDG
ncbi:hypothetical protein C8A03DRAFT_37649 [Achaetomium macrosporum]|uniref:Uncharacterized protein n=1 Tax=Achaetomium macrosporum TaxID=79813 RepID=A0AAN7C385_9PEZI|nr:hypothetical protein C8A03DRAFT_37649 [Achaetomium macrosporum]